MAAYVTSRSENLPYGRETYYRAKCDDCGDSTQEQDRREDAERIAREHVCGEGEWPPWVRGVRRD